MKHFLFAVLLFAAAFFSPVRGEDAVLTYSSFSGGGPDYTVAIADPSVVTYEMRCRYPYSGPEDLMPPGTKYSVDISFTGLKPGETAVTISSRGPLTADQDENLTAVVDEDLNVTLVWPRGLARLDFRRENADGVRDYSLFYLQDGFFLSRNDEVPRPADTEVIDTLLAVYDGSDLASWDGFDATGGKEGEAFSLYYAFTGGYPSMSAKGRGSFPENYAEAMDRIESVLASVFEVKRESPAGTYRCKEEGSGNEFLLTIADDGTYAVSEGTPGAYQGSGRWEWGGPLLVLTDETGSGFVNRFAPEHDHLVFVGYGSDNFPEFKLEDAARLEKIEN